MDNAVVITTKSILEGNANVAEIYHEDDGTWQAIPAEDFKENDAKVISMKNLIDIDESIKEILALPKGYMAIKKDNDWIITQQDDSE